MKIQIIGRREIEKMSRETPFSEKTAIICITDYENDFVKFKYKPDFCLQLRFDDVDNDVIIDEAGISPTEGQIVQIQKKYHMFTDDHAKEIASFYFSVCEEANVIICQCEHGQSRSAAIAAAIMEFKGRKGIVVFADDKYYPNKVVFRKTLKALYELSEKK